MSVWTLLFLVAAGCSTSTGEQLTGSVKDNPTDNPATATRPGVAEPEPSETEIEAANTANQPDSNTTVIASDPDSTLVIDITDGEADTATSTGSTQPTPSSLLGAGDSMPPTIEEFAAELSEAELAVRSTSLSADDMRTFGRRQQFLYRLLSVNREWVDKLPNLVDPTVKFAVEQNIAARSSLSSLGNTHSLADELPAWEVAEPLDPETLIGYYKNAEAETGIAWEFMAAINLVETRMGRIRGLSTAGAVGPMQFLPTTWAECCEGDPTVPKDAILGAGQYLVRRGGPENMSKAIFGYNNSQYYVDAVTAYASVMMEDERAYWGYHGWEVYYLSTEGLLQIPIGYNEPEAVPAKEWVVANPDALVDLP